MKRLACALLLLCAACTSTPFKDYEVPTLPEEVIGKALSAIPGGLERGDLEKIVSAYAADYAVEGYDPGRWAVVFSDPSVETLHWRPRFTEEAQPPALKADFETVKTEWKEFLGGYKTIARAELKPRLTNVVDRDGTLAADCTYFMEVKGVDADGRFRSDRLWIYFILRQPPPSEPGGAAVPWKVTAHRILKGDRVLGKRDQFVEIARENGTAYAHNPSPFFGPEQMELQTFPLVVRGDSGLAAADYNSDGWVDLYFCDGVRNALLRSRGDGTFEDVTKAAGLEADPQLTRSAIFADFDNDGDLDLYVTREKYPCRFYENLGNGTFRDATESSGLGISGYPTSLGVADYDNDGLLDLYIGCYGDFYSQFPSLKEKNGDANILFHNSGGLRFEDVTKKTGVGDRGWTLACTWGDYDNDGDPDLFVCNDFGENVLYRNEQGDWFTDMTRFSGVAVDGFGMSSTFGDYDNDGDLDIYLAGMYSNAGQWIFNRKELLPVPNFLDTLRRRVLGTLDYMTDGNRLLRNNGDGTFTERAREAGVDYGQFAWCSPWIDYDNDGDLDIYCVNGFWTGPDTEDL